MIEFFVAEELRFDTVCAMFAQLARPARITDKKFTPHFAARRLSSGWSMLR
jgi:hypothetical protein